MAYMTDGFDSKVVDILKNGGVGLMPSDTIYGLSARALDEAAVRKIIGLKGRGQDKALIVLISSIEMLDLLSIDKEQVKNVNKYWPGRITFECSAAAAPAWLPKLDGHFGVRIPDNEELLKLIASAGPLVSTSANLSGQPAVNNVEAAYSIFGDDLDFYVNVGTLEGLPSTLVRDKGGKLEVIRQGAVKIS